MKHTKVISCLLGIILATSMTIVMFSYFDIPQATTILVQIRRIGRIYNFAASSKFDNTCRESIKLSRSYWFGTKFKEDMPVFWSSSNSNIKEDTYKWWHGIQWSLKHVTYPELSKTVEQIFQHGVPKKQEIYKGNRTNCITCAVVGNSGNLKGSKYGATIDDHDIIIRFNQAPIKGFENDVGTKTSYQLMYPESVTVISKETSFTLIAFKPLDIQWLLSALTNGTFTDTYRRVPRYLTCNISKISIIQPEFLRHVHENWLERRGTYPSTGAVGVAMAIQMCDKIDLYGFGASKGGSWGHYWENLPTIIAVGPKRNMVHDGDGEKQWMEKLKTEGIIDIHMGVEY